MKLTYKEQYVLYVAATYYENNGSPGLDDQDDATELRVILQKVVDRLEKIVGE